MTDDLDAEFERLLKEKDHAGPAKRPSRTRGSVRKDTDDSGKGDRVVVADADDFNSGPVQRKSVPAGPAARSSSKNKPIIRASTNQELGVGKSGIYIEAFVPEEIPESRYPKRFFPGELVRGDSVWYRNERFYVDYFPSSWAKGTFARVASICPRPEEDPATFGHRVIQQEAQAFCVPVDTLQKAPTVNKPYAKQPSKLAVERRAEMKKAGVTDIGDEVAVMLRECDTLDAVYECTSLYVGMSVADLKTRYGHLNPGQQRMNLGNKMRFKLKHGRS